MEYIFPENFEIYFEEYISLILDFPEKQSSEIKHRRKMLQEWLDNEITQWTNENKRKIRNT